MEEDKKWIYAKKCKNYFDECKRFINTLEDEVNKGIIILDDLQILKYQGPVIDKRTNDIDFSEKLFKIEIKYKENY